MRDAYGVCVTNTVHLPGARCRYTDDNAGPSPLSVAGEPVPCSDDTLQPPRADISHFAVCARRTLSTTHRLHHRRLYTQTTQHTLPTVDKKRLFSGA